MGSKFCVKFQRAPLKFHTKFWTHTSQNLHFTVFYFCVWVTISLNCDVISLSETGIPSVMLWGFCTFPAHCIEFKLHGCVHYDTSRAWSTVDHAPMTFQPFLASWLIEQLFSFLYKLLIILSLPSNFVDAFMVMRLTRHGSMILYCFLDSDW